MQKKNERKSFTDLNIQQNTDTSNLKAIQYQG